MKQQCLCKQETVMVPRGNAFQLLMPFKTAHWEDESIVPEDLDILSLDNVHITIAGIEWTDFEMDPRGPIVTIGADDFDAVGAYSAEITAEYCGVPIRGAFFECFTRVEWSFESNVEQHSFLISFLSCVSSIVSPFHSSDSCLPEYFLYHKHY